MTMILLLVTGFSVVLAYPTLARSVSQLAWVRLGPNEDGSLPADVTAFDGEHDGISELDPDLLRALREATGEAAAEGVTIQVTSGWRSREHQARLLREAVAQHGSEETAARWVATPETSAHVSGDAVDIGPSTAVRWLAENGARHGLCPVYDNEPWHVELRPDAVVGGCPPTYPDPTHDPRMQRR